MRALRRVRTVSLVNATRWVASWISNEVPRGVAHRVTDDGPPRWHYRYALCSAMTMDIPAAVAPEPRRWCVACKGRSGAAA